jgi:hypothetical protein
MSNPKISLQIDPKTKKEGNCSKIAPTVKI